jgi:RNA polymerase sigma factor (TIGR02999 family)
MADVTQILSQIEQGDAKAAEDLLPLIYDELRKLAAARLAHEKPGQTLQATALVHEVYVRLVDQSTPQDWDSRGHFFAAAAEAMRRILVDNARRKRRVKHGGDRDRVDSNDTDLARRNAPDELLQIHEVIDQLAKEDETAGRLAKLCYFGGLELEQAGEILGISRATAYRHWAFAKAWLHREINSGE